MFEYINIIQEMLKRGKTGLVLDFDGTLSPISSSPEKSIVSPDCRGALINLYSSGLFSVLGVLSGRPCLEVRNLVGVPGLIYLGNHGMEGFIDSTDQLYQIKAARPFQPLIASVLEMARHKLIGTASSKEFSDGFIDYLVIENKGLTGSIHYRKCPDPQRAREKIMELLKPLAEEVGLILTEGRMVIELKPPVEFNKGNALLELVEKNELLSMIYIGDDTTDVDGFKALHNNSRNGNRENFQGLAIGVASPEMPIELGQNADYLLNGVPAVEAFLKILAEIAVISPSI